MRADQRTEDAHLVGRLVGAGPPQPRGPVGGDDDQGHAGVDGLKHCGVEVGDGGAGRAQDGRAGTDLGQPEREEPGRALVDPDVEAQRALLVGGPDGECERRAA